MTIELVNRVESTVRDFDHPYLSGAWHPNYSEYNATDMQVVGEIPVDIDGVYVRNTENQIHEAIGRYHPFDGFRDTVERAFEAAALEPEEVDVAHIGNSAAELFCHQGHLGGFFVVGR